MKNKIGRNWCQSSKSSFFYGNHLIVNVKPGVLGFGFVMNFERKIDDKVFDRSETTKNAKQSSPEWSKVLKKQYNMFTCRRTSRLLLTQQQQTQASTRYMVMTMDTETTRYRICPFGKSWTHRHCMLSVCDTHSIPHTTHKHIHKHTTRSNKSVDHCILPSETTCRFRTNTLALDSLSQTFSTHTKSYYIHSCLFARLYLR